MEKAFVEALRKFSSPTADFIALETTLSRQADPKLARLLIDTHLRVDRAAAEQILYVKSFEWMTAPPRDPREMYFSPNVLIPIARERDPARTKKALLAWMDASARQLGRQDSSMLNQLDEGVMAILDEGATKEDYKRLVAHPLMIQAPHGFIFRWAVSRKAKFDVNAEDLADFMVAQMEIQRHGFNFQLFEQFLGKSLPGPNDSLVRGLAKILPKAGEEMARSWTGWAEYLGPGFEKLSPAEMKDLQDRLRPSPDGMSGMRVLCTYLVSIQKGAREGTPAVFAAALGPDAPRNQKWIELFAYPGLPADAPKALAEGLQKPELPLASLEQGVYTGLTQKWKKEMTPVLRKAFQTRKENLQNLQGLARSHYTKAEWDAITKP
jgi:hypothetical protein